MGAARPATPRRCGAAFAMVDADTLKNLAGGLAIPVDLLERAVRALDRRRSDATAALPTDTTVTVGAPLRTLPVSPELADPGAPARVDRYEDLGLLGRGGMGEVRLVRDRLLGRELAMKLLLPETDTDEGARARFLAEARLTARLEHPGIVPVHDCGALPDGRLWFTMRRVRGCTLTAVLHALHAAPGGLPAEAVGRFVDTFARACEAVAHAHGRGVVHRDLKPENVMIGELGEVLVMDWGIARGSLIASAPAGHGTRAGSVLGTPAFMPPEQARGEIDRIGAPSDVYALGAILYAMLSGRAPFSGSADAVRAQLVHGPPEPIAALRHRRMPEALVPICERAMAREPGDRFPDARALAAEVRRFLDGAGRRERARAMVEEARAMVPGLDDLRARAGAAHAAANRALAALPQHAPEEEKAAGWTLEDEARALDHSVALGEQAHREKLGAALREAPDLDEAHEDLADVFLADLRAAELSRAADRAARAEVLLRAHARDRHAAFLRGDGAVTLLTSPEGAEVTLFRYVERGRRLHAEPAGELGRTPLVEVPLARGSYLLVVRAPGFRDMRYPVHVGRGEHWHGIPPGARDPLAIPLLPDGALGEDDVYVPAGWFFSGGDPAASESLPHRRRWADGLVARRHPVTQQHYLTFLNDLVRAGREDEAEAACPRAAQSVSLAVAVALFDRGPDGLYRPGPSTAGDPARYPVASVSWHAATAYAAWVAARTGLPFRLPGEEEREKAARGADGRFFPWGDQPETTWANMVSSRPGPAGPAPIEAYPIDESPHGVRGLAGNVRDWCCERWDPEGPSPDGDRVRVDPAIASDPGLRAIRGGGWMSAPPAMCRAAGRFAARPEDRFSVVGLRLFRPLAAPDLAGDRGRWSEASEPAAPV